MELSQGKRSSGYNWVEVEEDQQDAQKHPPFTPSSSSSSSVGQWGPSRIEETQEPSSAVDPPVVEREHMFDKVVTPSDVGKLNRLVIPKQHAEKYFPLDAAANEKGLLLSFEDRNGKPWRFRYSYWNSSQSYVMTKGWSRFVKEKRLDAGDTVSFGRGVGEAVRDRLFIDWKRRPDCHNPTRLPRLPLPHPSSTHGPLLSFARSPSTPWTAGRLFVPPPTPTAVFDHRHIAQGYAYNSASTSGGITAGQYVYLRSSLPPHGAVQLDASRMLREACPWFSTRCPSLTSPWASASGSSASTSTAPNLPEMTTLILRRRSSCSLDGPNPQASSNNTSWIWLSIGNKSRRVSREKKEQGFWYHTRDTKLMCFTGNWDGN